MATRTLAGGTDHVNISMRDALYNTDSEKTFAHDEDLPSLPIPPLNQTLKKYLDSVRCLVSDEEFQSTKSIVMKFEKEVGKELHEKLLQKAKGQRNWLEKWWEDMAYLSQRTPLLPLCSMAGIVNIGDLWPPEFGTQIDHASLYLHYQLNFWKLLRKEQLKPHFSHGIPWSMYQFRRLFSTARIPGETIDKIESHFHTESEHPETPTHVIILHCGHIFTFDAVDEYGEILTPPELSLQLERIRDWCQKNGKGSCVGALTVDDRTTWAQNREWLLNIHPENRLHMDTINTSLTALVLDEREPIEQSELVKETLAGDCCNRWADKSVTNVIFANGTFGMISDHTPFDGLVPVVVGHYAYLSLKECGGVWKGPKSVDRELLPPRRIDFHIDEHIRGAISDSRMKYQTMVDDTNIACQVFTQYGKVFLKPHNIHPETYVQFALHLAYYTMHGSPAACYMTTSTRQFYHGRTETLRSCFSELIEWVHAMIEDNVPLSEKLHLLHTASDKFKILLKDCMKNYGCDRHFLGMYMICAEEEIPVPEIFMDPSWVKSGGSGNFILSTSCCGYTPLSGCVMPMRDDGYGVFYNIENNRLTFTISAFNKCPDTSATKFYKHIECALLAMEHLLTSARL